MLYYDTLTQKQLISQMSHILSEHDLIGLTIMTCEITNLMGLNLFILFLSQIQRGDFALDDLDEHAVISLLTEVIEKIKNENQELSIQQAHIQVF